MRRLTIVMLSMAVLTIPTVAQNPARTQSDDAIRLKKKSMSESFRTSPVEKKQVLDKTDSKKSRQSADYIGLDAMRPQERRAELIRRLSKNFQSAQDRLDKTDTGSRTQELQQVIVTRLSELIEQAKESLPSQRVMEKQWDNRQQRAARSERRVAQRIRPGVPTDLGSKNSRHNTPPSAGNSGGSGDVNKLENLFRDVWGHLPETLRQEMNQYAREHFMTKYGDLLKQYYSTIAEKDSYREE
jgi:hypothetical protein